MDPVLPMARTDSPKRRIVVMGGSFNPPTLAHYRLMLCAVEAVGAEKGLFVPAKLSYVQRKMRRLKHRQEVLSEQTRLAMLNAMCEDDRRLGADDCEYGMDAGAQTCEMLEAVQRKYPDAELWFVTGGDKLSVVSHWHRSKELLERFRLLAATRGGALPDGMIMENPFLRKYAASFRTLPAPEDMEAVSSSRVRDLLRDGDESAAQMVHPAVWKLLLEEGWLKKDITAFRGRYAFLSNFYEAPIAYNGLLFGNGEAAFQAQKCADPKERLRFQTLRPAEAKREGRKVQLRPDWEAVKVCLMEEIVRAKFTQNPELAALLLATGGRCIREGNTWRDVFWGVDARTGAGQNHLGRILMKIREELRDGHPEP